MLRFDLAAFGTDRAAITPPHAANHVEDVPPIVGRMKVAPYPMGFVFACRVKADGSYTKLDDVYRHSGSLESAAILDPARLHENVDAPPTPSAPLEGDWGAVQAWRIGAVELYPYLALANVDDPLRALDDLRAGSLGYWFDGDRTAIRMVLDERNDDRLCNAFRQWQASNDVLRRDAT